MTQRVDLRDFVEDEYCEDVKEVASKVGVQVVCNDEDSEAADDKSATKNNDKRPMKRLRGFGAFFRL